MARFCIATRQSKSDYLGLTVVERAAFINELNSRR